MSTYTIARCPTTVIPSTNLNAGLGVVAQSSSPTAQAHATVIVVGDDVAILIDLVSTLNPFTDGLDLTAMGEAVRAHVKVNPPLGLCRYAVEIANDNDISQPITTGDGEDGKFVAAPMRTGDEIAADLLAKLHA